MKNKLEHIRTAKKLLNTPKTLIGAFALLSILIFALPAFGGSVSNSDRVEKADISSVNITLITGDTIAAYNISGKITYSILPDKTGISRNYQIIKSPQGTYFIPDGVDLKRVDMELFNIDYLLSEGYHNLSFIPVMMTFESIADTKKGIGAQGMMGLDKSIKISNINERIGVAAAILDKEETGSAFNTLLVNKDVSKVWLDKKSHISLSDSVPLIGAPTLWAQGYNGSGVKIAILDTGINAIHPDLNDIDDNPVTNDPKVLVQKNFVDWNYTDIIDNTTNDLYGHGTHVASIAAGTGEASGGLYKGVAPGAYLWNLRVLTKDGWGYDSWIINAINYSVYGADGILHTGDEADIISMSLGGGPTDGTDPMSIAVNAATDAGVVVVIAAGNCGNFCISTPGAADKVITVGATDKSDVLAYWSSRGPTLDYRVKPDVAAPGVNIIAARASGTSMGSPVNSYYTSASGTSMATPHVAGAAALLLQKGVPSEWSKPKYIKNVLISSSKDLNLSVYEQGGGRIQVLNASKSQVIPDPATLSFKIIKGVNTTVIKFHNLNTTSSRTLNLSVAVRDSSGNIVSAAYLNKSNFTIAPNSSASVLLTVNATNIPRSIYSGKLNAIADNGEKVRVIFGFATMNELRINKIKFNSAYAQNEFIWVYNTNVTNSAEQFSRFITTNSSGTAAIYVPDGEYNIWSGELFDNTWIWTVRDKLRVTNDTYMVLDERLSLPASFNENKPNQKFAALYSALSYNESTSGSSRYYTFTLLFYYPLNITTRVTNTTVDIAHSYEYYPATYYNPSDPGRINTPEWHKLYFSEQGISSPKNYVADYSKLVRRTGLYKTALINESAGRYEWADNRSYSSCICGVFLWQMDLPKQRIEYITPDTNYFGGLRTQNWEWIEYEYYWRYRSYPQASTPTEVWNAQPFSWSHNISRGSFWLEIYGRAFMDISEHYYSSLPVLSNFTLFRNGVKIYNLSTDGNFWYSNYGEPSTANYSAIIEGASNQNLSVRSRTVLNFSYPGTGDYRPPKIYLQIPNLDLYNMLQGDAAKINLSVIDEKESGFSEGTPDQLSSLSLEYSINDGLNWNTVALNHSGNGKYSTNISGLPNSTFVSLRSKAKDNSGNSASHELIRAFMVVYAISGQTSAYGIRDIQYQSLSPGSSTNVTVTIISNISQALSLQETIPSGWNLTRISDNADSFRASTNEWLWFNVSAGVTKTVTYRVTMPASASGTYYINGTISNSSGVIALVAGENTISSDILSYYRSLGSHPNVVETTDLLKAADDWSRDIAPLGFPVPITTVQLLALADEWSRS